MDGDLVYTRGEHDCRAYINTVNENGCALVLENWNGSLVYEMAYKLYIQTENGEWEAVTEVSGSHRSRIEQVRKTFDLVGLPRVAPPERDYS
jgi:hypothetical protein